MDRVRSISLFLALIACPQVSGAYGLTLQGQIFPQNVGEPNLVHVDLTEFDGAVAKSYDSGVVVSALDGVSWGRFTGNVDFAAGTLRTAAETSGDFGLAGATLGISDLLTFQLPAGMTETTVRFALTVDGTYSSPPPGQGYYVSGYAGIQLGAAGADNGGDNEASTFINRTFSGQTVVRDGETVSVSAFLYAYIDGLVGRGAGITASYDLSNTARISLQLEPGVTFTSQSGRFLADAAPLASFALGSSQVAGCKTVIGTVTLSSPAPAGGTVLSISDTLAAATTPATVRVAEGATRKTFVIRTVPVMNAESGAVSVALSGRTLSRDLTVRPMGPLSVTLTPNPVVGSLPVAGTAKLECRAGPGPVTVELASSDSAVANPVATSVVIPVGLQSQPFTVTTSPVPRQTSATISGTANGITKTKRLTVRTAAAVSPTRLSFGNVTVGTTSDVLTTTLSNRGAVPYSITSIGLAGTNTRYYAQVNNCPATLAAGASCTIDVTFSPTVAASRSAQLRIATSATSTPLSVALSGTGVLPP